MGRVPAAREVSGVDEGTLARLAERAAAAMGRAYAPYSGFRVGAALLAADGRIFEGCNVENASYPVGMCAERAALAAAVTAGAREFVAVSIATEADEPTPPCGMCRQALVEFAPSSLVVASATRDGAQASWTLGALLPEAFKPSSMGRR